MAGSRGLNDRIVVGSVCPGANGRLRCDRGDETGDPEDELKQALWARRAKRSHYNAVENLVVFATLVLVAFAMGKGDEPGILVATQVYFWARLVHFPAGAFGLPGIRTMAFLAGFGAQVAVALRIFS